MTTYKIESGDGVFFGMYDADSELDAQNMLYTELGYNRTDNPPPAGYLVVTEATVDDMEMFGLSS